MEYLIVGGGMFGAAIARHLAPHAGVTVIGQAGYGAHHDEGRIIGDASRDVVWSELNRLARDGMAGLDPGLITQCGALTAERSRADTRGLTAEAAHFGMVRFGRDETVRYQRTAGYFSPRRYVALAMGAARADGATIISGAVRALRVSDSGVEAELGDGRRVRGGAAIVASGAFAAGSDLLPVAVALRAKSEVYVLAELDEERAAELDGMPCVNREIDHPQLADLYVLPPIRYPDGRIYLKVGANTMIDHWLPDPAAVADWYDAGRDEGPQAAFREVLTDLVPGLRARAWHTRRCSDLYTAHGHPYIDMLEPGRLIVALGGNGRGAQAADGVGQLTAGLALTGRSEALPLEAFRCVPADGAWSGMTLFSRPEPELGPGPGRSGAG